MKKLIILIFLLSSLELHTQVLVVNFDELNEQYNQYSRQNEHIIRTIFAGELAKRYYCDRCNDDLLGRHQVLKREEVNLDSVVLRYKLYCKLELTINRNDTLFCNMKIDTFQLPHSTTAFLNDTALVSMSKAENNYNIGFYDKSQKNSDNSVLDTNQLYVHFCIERNNTEIYQGKHGFCFKIDLRNRIINDCFRNGLNTVLVENNNIVSTYLYDILKSINEFEPCKPKCEPDRNKFPDMSKPYYKKPWWKFW